MKILTGLFLFFILLVTIVSAVTYTQDYNNFLTRSIADDIYCAKSAATCIFLGNITFAGDVFVIGEVFNVTVTNIFINATTIIGLNDTIEAFGDNTYLRLDTTNDPLTDNLSIDIAADEDASLLLKAGDNKDSCLQLREGLGSPNFGFDICNDGSGTNRLVIRNHEGFEYFTINRDTGLIEFFNETVFHEIVSTSFINVSDTVTANSINISFILSTLHSSGMDIRGDPWFLSGAGFQATGDITADNFFGIYDWTILDDVSRRYLFFNGTDLGYNETSLNATIDDKIRTVTYNATTIETTSGTPEGDVESISDIKDGNIYNVTEAAGSNPLVIIINFSKVESFSEIVMREKYSAGSGHNIKIGIETCATGEYEEEFPPDITGMDNFAIRVETVVDPFNHLCDGNVSIRLRHDENGNPSHIFSLDYLVIQSGPTTMVSEEADPLSFHRSGDVVMQGNSNWGGFNFTEGSISASEVDRDLPSNCSENFGVFGWKDNLSTTFCREFEEPGNYLENGTDVNFENTTTTTLDVLNNGDVAKNFSINTDGIEQGVLHIGGKDTGIGPVPKRGGCIEFEYSNFGLAYICMNNANQIVFSRTPLTGPADQGVANIDTDDGTIGFRRIRTPGFFGSPQGQFLNITQYSGQPAIEFQANTEVPTWGVFGGGGIAVTSKNQVDDPFIFLADRALMNAVTFTYDLSEEKLIIDKDTDWGTANITANNGSFSGDVTVGKNATIGELNVTGANSTFEQDVTIKGTLHGGSPVKIAGGLTIDGGNVDISQDYNFTSGYYTILNEIGSYGDELLITAEESIRYMDEN
ncbi:hypothetical protein LCGC14_1228380, partial [marine sediment metagenome]